VFGLCGGYQMLGRGIADPDGIEGPPERVLGLGLLDVETVLTADKITRPASGVHRASGAVVTGYEIHLGRTTGPDAARPVLMLGDRPDGAASSDGRVQGVYLHGLFASDAFRRVFLDQFGAASRLAYETRVEATLDALADHVEAHLDLDRILTIARGR
jgi:adenosylcobyric acid synthase